MGVLRFDAADWVRFQTVTGTLANVSDGAWTCAILLKRGVDDSAFHGLTYLCSAGPVTEAGLTINNADALLADINAAPTEVGPTITGTVEQYLAVAGKPAGAAPVDFSRYAKSTNTWTHSTSSTSVVNQIAATMLEIGTFEGGSDMANAWIGLVGWWEGNMSQANRVTLSTNWRTSDWWANPHGQPKALIQLNGDAASLVDLAAGASNILVTGTPTLDTGETLDSFAFNGTGEGAGVDPPVVAGQLTRGLAPEGN